MTNSNNKRIAKNSLFLYLRMFLSMAITIYTSRIILKSLGVEDYGIYNIVGGIITMFSSIYASLSTAISRFITFALGENDQDKLKKIFVTAINIQILFSLIALILAESIGMWFMHAYMNIPIGKIGVAEWVLHFSVMITIVNLISIPYNALIVAHEKMQFFAYISIFEVIMKLVIAYVVIYSPYDRLFTYVFLLFLLSFIIRCIYGRYCSKIFPEIKYTTTLYINIFKEMSSFAGWNFFGNVSNLLSGQGINILINIFFNVTFNAARGVASQVESAINQFVNSFSTAFMPQITKSYASGDLNYMSMLIRVSTKFSRLLILFPIVPLIIETDMVLSIWLEVVPEQTAIFLKIILLTSFITVVTSTLVSALFAIGQIKRYQLVLSVIHFLIFPVSWVFFYWGMPAWSCFCISFIFYSIANIWRLLELKRLLNFSIYLYFRDSFMKPMMVFLLAIVVSYGISMSMDLSMSRLYINILVTFMVIMFTSYYAVLNVEERKVVSNALSRIMSNIRK